MAETHALYYLYALAALVLILETHVHPALVAAVRCLLQALEPAYWALMVSSSRGMSGQMAKWRSKSHFRHAEEGSMRDAACP